MSSSSSSSVTKSIDRYCGYKSELSDMNQRRAKAVKKLEDRQKQVRDGLEQWMVTNKINVVHLPPSSSDQDQRHRTLRLRKTSSQRCINEKSIRKAFESFFSTVPQDEQLDLTKSKETTLNVTKTIYNTVHGECVKQGQAVSVTFTKQAVRPPKTQEKLPESTLEQLSKYTDLFIESQTELREKRKHYCEGNAILQDKLKKHEDPVKRHLLQQKETVGQPVQKITLVRGTDQPEDVSLRFQQRTTMRTTKRLNLTMFRQMIVAIVERRRAQLLKRNITSVTWKDFLPVLIEDLIHEVQKYYEEHREKVTRENIYFRKASTKKLVQTGNSAGQRTGNSAGQRTGNSAEQQSDSSGRRVRNGNRKRKASKKRS